MSYSIQRVTSDGTLTDVVVGIEFMSVADIQVYVDEILANGTRDYSYIWVNSNTIRLTPPVAVGSEVMLVRSTYIDTMVHDYEAGAVFNPKSMDENFTQLLYNVQEGGERTNLTDIYNDVNMHNHNIKNLAVAVNDYDAIPFIQYKEDALGAQEAAERAEDAADRAEAAAAAGAGANLLYDQVKLIEPHNNAVWWKGQGLFAGGIQLYDGGVPGDGSGSTMLDINGNIGTAGTRDCAWTIPSSTAWTPRTDDLYSYLRFGGLNNGMGRLPGDTTAYSAARGIYVANSETGLGGQITIQGDIDSRSMTLLNYSSPVNGRHGINFLATGYNGASAANGAFNARIDNGGNIQAQSNILAGGDIVAFANIGSTRMALSDTYPNVTTLEANPNEFGLLDIVEKLAEVIVNLKVKIEALEGALDAITPR